MAVSRIIRQTWTAYLKNPEQMERVAPQIIGLVIGLYTGSKIFDNILDQTIRDKEIRVQNEQITVQNDFQREQLQSVHIENQRQRDHEANESMLKRNHEINISKKSIFNYLFR